MSYKPNRAVILRDLQQFMENFDTPPSLPLTCFHPVQFPIAITEAAVRTRSVQDYSVLSLLILRLFDAGFCTPEAIQSISGMSLETVRTYIEKEERLLEHIDPKTHRLTKLGQLTLAENDNPENDQPKSCQYYESVLRVHVDAVSATLVPYYLEREFGDNIQPNENAGDFILPRETAQPDEDFTHELNTRLLRDVNDRLEEHIRCDALKNGDVLDSITALRPIRIFYRRGYLVLFEGMTYPMMVFSGKRTADNVNADSLASGEYNRFVTVPLAISQTDETYLAAHGIRFSKVIVRRDDCFTFLREKAAEMTLTLPSEDEQTVPESLPVEDDEEVESVYVEEPDWTMPPAGAITDPEEEEGGEEL